MPDDERALLDLSRSGDLDAFEHLVRLHQDRVFNLAYRITGNHEDAADAAQEAFLRAYQALPRFRADAAFGTWLYRIATNAALDLVRRRPRVPPVDLPADGLPANRPSVGQPWGSDPSAGYPSASHPSAEGPEAAAHRREVSRRVQAALAALPPEFRAAVVLRDLEGLAYEEVARILGVPTGTVRSRISRGREAMRALLRDLVAAEG